jgi:hypothetical protein
MEIKKLFAICISLAGCASHPQPTESLAASAGAVRGAQEAGAEQLPDAALHLRLAQEGNERAKQLMAEGDNERAAFMTERARMDAELALALAHQERAQKRAQQASASVPGAEQGQPGAMPQQGQQPSQPQSQPQTQPQMNTPSTP